MKFLAALIIIPNIVYAGETLWDQWYEYSVNSVTEGYYHEEVELNAKSKEIQLNQHWWEKNVDETFSKETFIGSTAKVEKKIIPIAFYVEKRGLETLNIEGRIKDKQVLVNIKRMLATGEKQEKLSFPFPANTILSSFFSYFLAQKGKEGIKKPFEYSAVIEDSDDLDFGQKGGKAQILGESKKFGAATCFKATLTFMDIPSIWWITKEGRVCETQSPTIGAKIAETTEAKARAVIKIKK